jgi:hypothetical protein
MTFKQLRKSASGAKRPNRLTEGEQTNEFTPPMSALGAKRPNRLTEGEQTNEFTPPMSALGAKRPNREPAWMTFKQLRKSALGAKRPNRTTGCGVRSSNLE